MSETTAEAKQRIFELIHAMQSGVGIEVNHNSSDYYPNYLRAGVNSAMVEHAALVQLLLDKGIITEEEYSRALNKWMESEAEDIQKVVE